ncbi:MAG: transposase [Chloroflexi bacterium]|nr:transposase [Chloroflexota bacterium]
MTHPPIRQRRSIRLQGYDYTLPGAYFITICTFERQLLFDVLKYQQVVHNQWFASASIRPELRLDAFVVMPNHVHGIVWITETDVRERLPVGAQGLAPLPQQPSKPHVTPRSLGAFVRGFKSAVTREVNALRRTPGTPVWQRNYYEQVVRTDDELNNIRQYIVDNPRKWQEDENNPANLP